MSFMPKMTSRIEGVRLRRPLQWRSLGRIVVDLWRAEGEEGGRGYYLSPDPRIVIFFEDVAETLRISEAPEDFARRGRPLGQVSFVPAGRPLWSRIVKSGGFSHLDLHFDAPALHRLLAARLGDAEAEAAMRRPVTLMRSAPIEALARLLAEEVARPVQHDLFAESLAQGIVAALLPREPGPAGAEEGGGGLNKAQMRRLAAHLRGNLHRRVPVGELAAAVGLSESWFAHSFKQTAGETPLQWQLRLRIEQAQKMLVDPRRSVAEVAAATGFADQAHLTRVFRARTGGTPAAWRRTGAA